MKPNRETLKELVSIRSDDPVASLYLPLHMSEPPHVLLNSIIRSYKKNRADLGYGENKTELLDIKETLENIRKHVAGMQRQENANTAFVVFGPGEDGIVHQTLTTTKTEPSLTITDRPYVVPLLPHLSKHSRFVVVLAERERTRLMSMVNGDLRPEYEMEMAVPQKVRRGSGDWRRFRSDPNEHRIDRHIRWHLSRFMGETADRVFGMFNRGMGQDQSKFDYVIVGTHTELEPVINEQLHPYLKERVVGSFNVDLDENFNEIKSKASAARDQFLKSEEEKVLKTISDNLGEKGLAVVGIDDVKKQMDARSVMTLAIKENNNINPLLLNRLIAEALDMDADIVTIKHNAEQMPDDIAAMLRFHF